MTSPGDSKRVPLRVRLPFSTQAEFLEKYGVHLSPGGIFIATRSVKPVGTLLSLEVVLADGNRVMRAEGVVEASTAAGDQGTAGMLVRFTRVDGRTKALLDTLAAGGPLTSELPAAPPSPADEAPTPAVCSRPTPTPTPADDDVVLGIDLGTTTCRVAIIEGGAPRLLPIPRERGAAMPSMVAFDAARERLLVGSEARTWRLEHPEATVMGFKRLLGRRARSKEVRQLAQQVSFTVTPDMEGDVGVDLAGRTWQLTELAALLLRELKQAAQEHLGREVSRAVLCVPAWYSDHQRGAMLEAGRLAGLDVLRLINEPSAVALAFGFGRGLARKRVLVYDLGGGTFDAAVVEVTGDDIDVVSTGGDIFLGGVDFDRRLSDALIGTLTPAVRESVREARVTIERIRDAAESAKIALSEAEHAPVRVPFITLGEGSSPVDLEVDVERGFLEASTGDLVERTVAVTQVVLEAARLTPAQLDEVLMVGGQSRAPAVQRHLQALLGRAPRTDVDAQGAVALGAALYGQALVQRERGKHGLRLSEVLGAPIGIAVQGGGVRRVLERNTRLPAEKTLTVPVEAGRPIALAVYQGAAPTAEDNEYLGAARASFERSGDATLHFALSADGRLAISAGAAGQRQPIVTFATTDAPDDVRAALLAESPLPGDAPPPTSSPSGLFTGIKKLFGM